MKKHTLAAAAAALGLSQFPAPAQAQTPSAEIRQKVVNDTIDQLNAGENQAVISHAYERHGYVLNGWALNAHLATERQRDIVYCVALAVLRSEGKWSRTPDSEAVDGKVARGNLDWAIRALESLAMFDLVPERHIAEAWARDPSLRTAALDLLRKMEAEGRLENEVQRALLRRLEDELTDMT